MRRRLTALGLVVFVATIGWLALRDILRGYWSTRGAHVHRFTLRSQLLHRKLGEVLVTPRGGGKGRLLLVFLHGRSSAPDSNLSDPFFKGLRTLGELAPNVLFANGGDHSYFHNRADGLWGSSILREAIPAAIKRSGADPRREIGRAHV